MATAQFFQPDIQADQAAIERNRLLAERLQRQSEEPAPGAGMAGRVFVGNSWTQGLAKLLQGYNAGKARDTADDQTRKLAALLQKKNTDDMSGFMEAMQGKPAQSFQTGANEMGDEAATQNVAAQSPDRMRAMQIAMNNPMLQPYGAKLMEQLMPKTPKWEKFDKPDGAGGHTSGFVDVNSPNPISTFQVGGAQPAKMEFVNGQGVNPYNTQTQGAPIPKQPDAPNLGTNLVIPGPNGQMVPNAPLIQARRDIAKSGASSQNVNVNTATKPFLNQIGEGVGKQVINDFEGARAAQQTLNNVQQIKEGLGSALLGPGAGVRVKLSQIGQVLGVNGADATEQLENTRKVIQGLARQELSAAGAMKGQGQITESERGILRRAESGEITDFTKPELQTLLSALTKTAGYRIGIHNQNLQRMQKDPNAAGVVDYLTLPTGGASTSSVLDQADAIIRGGK